MTTLYGIDTSFAYVTPERARQLAAAGVRVAFQCLWTGATAPEHRVSNLRSYIEAGIIVGGYISVSSGMPGEWHVGKGREGVPDDIWNQLVLVPVDVELPNIKNDEIRAAVERLVGLGKRRAIYTSYGHWTTHQGNSRAFIDCLLWNAFWDGQPDMDFERLPYGGWSPTKVFGEQWSGGTMVTGSVLADRNTFVRELLVAEPDRMTDVEIRGAFAAILGTIGRQAARVDQLEKDLRGTFRYLHEHVTALEGHGTIGSNILKDVLLEKVEDLEERIGKQAATLTSVADVLSEWKANLDEPAEFRIGG